MRYFRSSRSFLAGIVLGILIGSASVGTAAISYKTWQGLSQDIRVGYVLGFLSMARLARNLHPGGWVDQKYPLVDKARPVEWARMVDQLYMDPEYQTYTVNSVLQAAAQELEEKYGRGPSPEERARERMRRQLGIMVKNREARAKNTPPGDKKVASVPATKEPGSPDTKKVAEPAPKKKQKKWCRCDGTDPKQARARRRAAAAGKDTDDGNADTKPADQPTGEPSPE